MNNIEFIEIQIGNKNYLFLGLLMVSIFITAIYVVLFNKSGI